MTPITEKSIVTKREGFLTSDMDDGLAMMSIENSAYYSMDSVGRSIWQAFEEAESLEDICKRLMARYDVLEEECLRDLVAYMEILRKNGLVDIA